MKKPLLLLVDDDPSVLAALEGALRPRFEAIAHIEAFDDPALALGELPRWESDGRALAVVICDQRMRVLAGIELLIRLKLSPAAAHVQTILLTGYGGLESALDAKNTAGVDRYMEKPWDPGALAEAVGTLLAHYLGDAGADTHLVLREVEARQELVDLLRLRRAVYDDTSYTASVLPTAVAPFDVDAYDSVSYHFGLFLQSAWRPSQLVGGIRVVTGEERPVSAFVSEIVSDWPDLVARASGIRLVPLPLMTYLLDAPAVLRLYRTLTAAGEVVVEPGRFVVESRYRGLHLGLHVVQSMISFFFFFLEIENAILTCHPSHSRLYVSVGFKRTAGAQKRYHPKLGGEVDCLHGTRRAVPAAVRERVDSLAARIRRTGATCHCATFPACLPGPYETGDFSAVDILCPLRAAELLRGGLADEKAGPPAGG